MSVAFVTGITGQDGGYLAERLLADGRQVHGLVRPGDGAAAELRERLPEVVLHDGDLAEADQLGRLIRDLAPDEVYNLGGLASVARSWAEPLLTAQVTGLGAAVVLAAAWDLHRDGHPVRVLQASSAEIFGLPDTAPQTEATPIRPVSPYGAAKAFAHQLVSVYRGRGLAASACIFYNHESPRRPTSYVTRKITAAVAAIAAGRQDTLLLGSLDTRRDWGWAPDYVDAMVRAVRHGPADDYVIATGESHSIEEFVAAAFARAGIERWKDHVELDPALARPVDAHELVGDAGKAARQLGWRPRHSFTDVVARMVDADLQAAGLASGVDAAPVASGAPASGVADG